MHEPRTHDVRTEFNPGRGRGGEEASGEVYGDVVVDLAMTKASLIFMLKGVGMPLTTTFTHTPRMHTALDLEGRSRELGAGVVRVGAGATMALLVPMPKA